ncbi:MULTISPECIES: OmpA family protein [unclassified Oceanispirochaeta]|uniref:OmpA family protein n=1 Tax=unclassified Oceanispirochaeta TaxID=2635722 RepID=UPI000E094FE2|nr:MULTISPECIES: OmpA family protein [unclassified Oceanispirochaeta]MBF9017819.1 OmpA family protein [Oceanispirochaeta sp. M2]NPD74279.1 OmpA family protein [Oceanispirochaeta sp. M1]RDG29869.1 OmpA family protein [Oceanispirochaeta sp. M1]
MAQKIIPCFFLFYLSFSLFSQEYSFNQEEGMRYRIVSEVNESVWLEKSLLGQSTILNRIGVEVLSSDPEGALLEVSYGISEKSLDTGLYIYNRDDVRQFYRSHIGLYGQIPLDEYLPSVRNVPTWPEHSLQQGDSWSAMAEEVHDLLPFFQVDYRLHIPFRVFYTFVGVSDYEGRSVDIIEINYHFLKRIDTLSLPPDSLPGKEFDIPGGVSGDFKQTYLWDREAGIPAAVEEEFSISYSMASGRNYTFKGNAKGKVIEADQWIKEEVRDRIEDAVEEIDDISVSISDAGVVLTLDNIHFVADSSEFLPEEESKLMQLKDILLQFPEHDLLITGHTAKVGFSSDEGQQLSEERAAAVASFFLSEHVREASGMIVQGKGSREPLGDNSSEEGRRKNRRVEITILDN